MKRILNERTFSKIQSSWDTLREQNKIRFSVLPWLFFRTLLGKYLWSCFMLRIWEFKYKRLYPISDLVLFLLTFLLYLSVKLAFPQSNIVCLYFREIFMERRMLKWFKEIEGILVNWNIWLYRVSKQERSAVVIPKKRI